MPAVYPFRAVQFRRGQGDLSNLVAPPYDVLDKSGKELLLKKDPANIVGIDLPHTPAKELGPAGAYQAAADSYRAMLAAGTLTRLEAPAMFAYRQTFTSADGRKHQRTGMACTVETVAFGPREGGGILPHEETFSGPKEDRMALMVATRAQLSPIFGLFADDSGRATALLKKIVSGSSPTATATTADQTFHEVWTITDAGTIKAYQDALAGEDVFIADGHHRYNTGLSYLQNLSVKSPLAADHPARRCMIVLVGMSDPGLAIWPTHRVLGGMKHYSIEKFLAAASADLSVEPFAGDLHALDARLNDPATPGGNRMGLWDFQKKQGYLIRPSNADPLKTRFGAKPEAWRKLDVALIQYVIVEGICQPKLNDGQAVKWAFPHTIKEVADIGAGLETGAGGGSGFAQMAVIVRPTPLDAVKSVSRANELMPQKSTFFYPKLATGLFVNPLE